MLLNRERVDTQIPDNVMLNGVFTNGGLLNYQIMSVPHHSTGWRMVVYGPKRTLNASTKGLPQITPVTLLGSRGNEPLVELPIPERLRITPAAVPGGPA